MNIIFIHRNFPAQFKFLADILSKNSENNVLFVTNNVATPTFGKIRKLSYKLKRKVPDDCHRYLRFYEESIIHGQAAAELLASIKMSGFKPDVIVGHSWGNSLFVKEIFPEVPYIAYIEWYYNYHNSDVDFKDKNISIDEKASLMCKNAHILQDLVNCDYAISPTNWQKAQIPKIFHDKIKILHEGINTDICVPDENVQFKVPQKDIILTSKDEVLTYATRGMEEYRGFPEFMKAASILMKQRPNMHVLIGGEDRVCYGRQLRNDTFKQKMLRELEFDMDRLHFTGPLPYTEYLKLLQVSTVHIYLTYPFVLSWSFIEAMSCGCRIIASDTAPVQEVLEDGKEGLMVDFYDIDKMVSLANDIMDNREKYDNMRKNAREKAIKNYNLKTLLPQQLEFLTNVAKNKLVLSK